MTLEGNGDLDARGSIFTPYVFREKLREVRKEAGGQETNTDYNSAIR